MHTYIYDNTTYVCTPWPALIALITSTLRRRGPRVAPTPQEVLMNLPEALDARHRNIDDTAGAVQVPGGCAEGVVCGVWCARRGGAATKGVVPCF